MPQALKKITTDHYGQPQGLKVEKSSYPEKGHNLFRNKLTFEPFFSCLLLFPSFTQYYFLMLNRNDNLNSVVVSVKDKGCSYK